MEVPAPPPPLPLPLPHPSPPTRPPFPPTPSTGLLWYAYCLAAAFVVLVARVAPHLTLAEVLAATVPVGTVASAWIIFLVAVLTSAIGCVRGGDAREGGV